MAAHLPIVLLAFTALVVVATALGEVLVLRVRERRDLDGYLQWLLQHATGPVNVSRLRS